jgi:hypothetical protein
VQRIATAMSLAVVMNAGPQIISAVFLATSEKWLRNSLAFLSGVALATVVGTSIAYWTASAATSATSTQGSSKVWLDYVLVVLLVFLAVRGFLKRNETSTPAWMGRLSTANAGLAFKMGLLLYLLMPTDIASMATAGGYLARAGGPWSSVLWFVAATLLIAGSPLLLDLLLGKRAEVVLPKLREWMTANAWIVSEFVIAIFLAMQIKSIVSG